MEPYKPLTLKKKPQKCPICGGEVWKILYGEPTAEAYETRFKDKIIYVGAVSPSTTQHGSAAIAIPPSTRVMRNMKVRIRLMPPTSKKIKTHFP